MSSPTAFLIRQAYREGGKARKRTLPTSPSFPRIRSRRSAGAAPIPPMQARGRVHDLPVAAARERRRRPRGAARLRRRAGDRAPALALAGSGGRPGRAADSGAGIEARRRPALPAGDGGLHLGVAARPAGDLERGPAETMDWLLERQPRMRRRWPRSTCEGSPVLYDLTSVWS